MTLEEKIKDMIIGRGMLEEWACEIVARAKADARFEGVHWDDSHESYPGPVFSALWLTVKYVVREWIKEHKPGLWCAPLFD